MDYILARNIYENPIEVLPGFNVCVKPEGGYMQFSGLSKDDWSIWPIKDGYQTAELVEGSYKNHRPFSNIKDAQLWVDEQIVKNSINVNDVRNRLKKALDAMFSMYSYENMINDTDLTKAEKDWANEHTYPDIAIIPELKY